ncbi:MAG: DUF4124 domain-containing protein [Pseudomonadota bacterium]
MHYRISFIFACAMLAIAPSSAFAEIYKCANSAGQINFSDRPCKDGEKAAEVKDSVGFASLLARENAKKIGQTCWTLAHRTSQCQVPVGNALNTNFRENCNEPIKRFEKDAERERYELERNLANNRIYTRSNNENAADESNLDYSNRYQKKSKEALRCEVLKEEMWAFVKQNFSKKISEKDTKEIEYYMNAVPSDGRENDKYRRR